VLPYLHSSTLNFEVYALVNSATGIGLLSAVIFVGGSLDIYINSKNDKELDNLEERLCISRRFNGATK